MLFRSEIRKYVKNHIDYYYKKHYKTDIQIEAGYNRRYFSKVYTFKNDLSAQLTQVLSKNALTSLADTISTA